MEELGSVISRFLDDKDINHNLKKFSIFNHWADIVGTEIAKKSRPVKIFKEILYIKVINPVWANEMSLMSVQIIKKINGFIGADEIRGLKFKLN